MIELVCPECDYTYDVASELAGKKVRCPKCNTRLWVPEESEAAFRCPKCGSSEVFRCQVVYEGGTFDTDGGSLGIGVVGDSIAVLGIGSRGRSQSKLAQRVGPPEKKRTMEHLAFFITISGLISSFVLFMISLIGEIPFFTLLAFVWSAIWIALVVFFLFKQKFYEKMEHAAEIKEWRKKYLCKRCGKIFLPV